MKKIVAVIASSIILAGATVMNVSAADYEVEKGDSLWRIAQDFNTTVDDLININGLDDTIILPKQELLIYKKYLVQKGDTLYSIGKDHDVSVEDLMKWNELKSDLILIGQELTIKKSSDRIVNDEVIQTVAQTSAEPNNEKPEGKTLTMSATAYTAKCDGCTGITFTGVDLNADPNAKVIAVDPNVIPLGSKVYVEGYGYAIAADIGSAIKGNKIDIHVPTKSEAFDWGVRTVDVTIIEE